MPEVQKPVLGQSEKEKALTVGRLKESLDYNPETGVFVWRVSRGKARAGSAAGCVNDLGYTQIVIDKRCYLSHRLVCFWMTGAWPANQIDHVDGDRSNNRWSNLRDATKFTNAQNRRGPAKSNKHGYFGASPNGKWWQAKITVNRMCKYLGTFATPEEAHAAYLAAKRELHDGCTI